MAVSFLVVSGSSLTIVYLNVFTSLNIINFEAPQATGKVCVEAEKGPEAW